MTVILMEDDDPRRRWRRLDPGSVSLSINVDEYVAAMTRCAGNGADSG